MKIKKVYHLCFQEFCKLFSEQLFWKTHLHGSLLLALKIILISLTWSYKLTKNRQSQWPHKFSGNSRNNFSLVDIRSLNLGSGQALGESLTMVPVGNNSNRLSLVNHSAKSLYKTFINVLGFIQASNLPPI